MLTLPEWMMLMMVLLCAIAGCVIVRIHPFLAVHEPIEEADLLIVEGWLPDQALGEVITEFKRKPYQRLITTGLPLFHGFYLAEYKTYAELACATLEILGIDREKMVPISAPDVTRGRTRASAIAVKEWLAKEAPGVTAVNLYSMGTHTRRSRYVYKQALGPDVKIGSLAAQPGYEIRQWWTSSEGVKSVMIEVISYTYTLLFNRRVI